MSIHIAAAQYSCSYRLAIPVFLIVDHSSILDSSEELFREKIQLLEECNSVECLDTSNREILNREDHTRDNQSKECHRDHELKNSESSIIFGLLYHCYRGER